MAKKKAKNIDEQKVVIPPDQAIPKIKGRKVWEIPRSHRG